MTLVELLVLIVIIGVLAELFLSGVAEGDQKLRAQIACAKIEMRDIKDAIRQYRLAYKHLPIATNANNASVITILMDIDQGANAGHRMNPNRIQFLTAKLVPTTNAPGVSSIDYQYRDPWGNPYIIWLGMSDVDEVHERVNGRNAISSRDISGSATNYISLYGVTGKVMIWSLGPDGKADASIPANEGVNKDNVLGWQQ